MPYATPIVLQQIDLDIVPGKTPPIVHVSEYDTGRQILVNLFRDGYPFGTNSIESYTVKVEGTIGKYGFSENAAWDSDADGVVAINLTEAMTAIRGRVWTKIKLVKSETMQISTCGFWLDVDRAGVEANTVIGAPGFEQQIIDAVDAWLDENYSGGDLPNGDVERLSWHQCPEAVQSYLANVTYSPSDYTSSQIAIYAPATPAAANTKPIGYTTGGVTYYNEVPNEQTPFANEQTAGTLEPLDRLRLINCPTASNVRDLGGWSCDGGTVRYGLLFRGGEPTAQDAAVLVDECGVKFELNLRGRPEAQREYSILGNIGYAVFDAYAWYSISDTALWRQMLRTLFDAVNNSIPVYFHCSAGADRTGTFACILEALLGMNQSDCDKDYELTCFYTGTDTDAHGRRRDENDWKGLINQINAKEGNSFRDKVVNFVLSLGISVNDINRFRAVMIDGTPEILVNTHHTVTNTLTGVTNSNAAMTAEEHQPYTATLTPNSGKLIDSVTVTMGGTDITSQVFSGTAATRKVSVTQNLTNCKSNDPREFASVGESYILTLTADEDYTLTGATVTITMGGTDVSQYYSNGTISIPNVTGDIVITATAVASADTTIALNWNNGYNCSYTVGQSIEMTQNASYAVTDLIPVTTGKTYTVKIDGIENLKAFRFVGANSNGIVTETIEGSNGQTTIATFTPASGTTQMRLRGYSSAISDLQQFVMTES